MLSFNLSGPIQEGVDEREPQQLSLYAAEHRQVLVAVANVLVGGGPEVPCVVSEGHLAHFASDPNGLGDSDSQVLNGCRRRVGELLPPLGGHPDQPVRESVVNFDAREETLEFPLCDMGADRDVRVRGPIGVSPRVVLQVPRVPG